MKTLVRPEMVKGARLLGDERPVAVLIDEAQEAYGKREIAKALAPELAPLLGAMQAQAGIQTQLNDMRKTLADLTKTEVTGSYPISGSQTNYGFAVYNLDAPSKKIFPVLSPFRNRVPRTPGRGGARKWKQITGISGSGGANPVLNHFLAELPSNTVGGMVLNLPPEITLTGADKTVSYVPIGASGSNSMVSQWAAESFEDLRALVGLSTLQALMLSEERGLWAGRTSAVAAPTITSATAGAASGSQVAITGFTTNVYVKVTAVTMMGESVASAASTVAVSAGQVVTVVIGTVTGAEGYNIYVSTGGADPGDASRFFAGTTGWNTFILQGALPTSGNTPPAGDSTASANAYLGVFPNLEQGGGTISSLNAALQANLADIANQFVTLYRNLKADPEEIWSAVGDRYNASQLAVTGGTTQLGYRLMIEQDSVTGIVQGALISQVINPATGRAVPWRTHPWMHDGNIVGLSFTLPFPNSQVPNVWEVNLPQEYVQIDWPVIDMNYRTSVLAFGALIPFAPGFNFWLKAIKSQNPSLTNQ